MKLDCVVITGAGQGIGRAIAADLGSQKVHVLCLSKSDKCEVTAAEIRKAGGMAEGMVANLGQFEKVGEQISAWIAGNNFKRIGIVLAAGMLGPQDFQNLAGWEECYRVNVLGNLAVCSGLLPRMLENKFGRIVCFAGGGAAYACIRCFRRMRHPKAAMVQNRRKSAGDVERQRRFCRGLPRAWRQIETNTLKLVRAAGAEIKTTVDISEPVNFAREFLFCETCGFKGSFVHVRDNWRDYLDTAIKKQAAKNGNCDE